MRNGVDLLVPIKSLDLAKSRLRGAADGGIGHPDAHRRLVLALARDTVAAAGAARGVRRVVAISPDTDVLAALGADGADVLPDRPDRGLNAALRHGAALLRRADPDAAIGALQADLPALRPEELDAALACAALAPRAFCTDAAGSGTTLLCCAPGVTLAPRFGPGSAAEHERSGALRLDGDWPGLRCDVDTVADLDLATRLGLGPATRSTLLTRAAARP